MSDSLLEKSLDDIIGESRKLFKRGGSRPHGKRPTNARSNNGKIHKAPRPHPVNIRRSGPIPPSVRLPRDVLDISRGRPVLRVKNVHPDLNGEDLSKLFGSVSAVDFVKFDNKDDTIAYVCFHNDNQRANGESVAKFDGKKAMGNRLIVEVATSLADRIQVQNATISDRHHTQINRPSKHKPSHAKPLPKKQKPQKKSLDTLDEELNAYMNQNSNPDPQEPVSEPVQEPIQEQNNDDMNLD